MRRAPRLLLSALMATVLGAGGPAVHGIRPGDFDPSVAPCQDFFQYANGGWLKANPIPGDHSGWGAFDEVEEGNNVLLKRILEEAAASRAPEGSVPRKVGDFFAAGMDTRAIAKAGLAPLRGELARIEALHDARGLAEALGRLHLQGAAGGFGLGVGQDDRDSTAYIAQLSQGGLGLPDRDYYLQDDPSSREIRAKYLDYLAGLLVLAGEKPVLARVHANVVLDLEKRLARASMTRVECRDPQAIYHKLTPGELRALAPGFPWDAYGAVTGLKGEGSLLVRQPLFFRELGVMARDMPSAPWKAYLRVRLLDSSAPFLGEAFEKAHFAFHAGTLSGVKEMSPRWKRVLRVTDGALGEDLGQLYVAQAFTPRAKARALDLVAQVRAALRERILHLDWMAESTRQAALGKLDAFKVKIGYPDTWRDYTSLRVERSGYLANVQRAATFAFRRDLAKLGQPIDRSEWGMTPSTVNAYYDPQLNEIVFPAGILQPPFFDAEADDAVNFGAIGMVIGHEMTHGFDDQGCQYDAKGNLVNWWTDADRAAYVARTDKVVRQFDALEALPGVHLNGRLTLGENIADLGGLKIAYAALQKSLEGRATPLLDGFTPQQRFFLGYAQCWHFQAREASARMSAMVDTHSPSKARVNGPLANLPEFAEAFGCRAVGPMNRPEAERPTIW